MILPFSWLSPRLLLAVAALCGGCTVDPPGPTVVEGGNSIDPSVNVETRDFGKYTELVWSDEFDGADLDQKNWTYEVRDVWFNNELQATTRSPDNVSVSGGRLNITARPQSYNGRNYTSGRINTKGKHEFLYGRLDVRAKLPKGKGIWPAIWMLGANDDQVSWPACGEIDIMELRGSDPRTTTSALHYGASVASHQYVTTRFVPGFDLSADFHTYSLVRGQGKLELYVDGTKYQTWTSNDLAPYPFNKPFYAILNVAVGGDFDGNPDASTTFPQTMLVDYVRFYQYK